MGRRRPSKSTFDFWLQWVLIDRDRLTRSYPDPTYFSWCDTLSDTRFV